MVPDSRNNARKQMRRIMTQTCNWQPSVSGPVLKVACTIPDCEPMAKACVDQFYTARKMVFKDNTEHSAAYWKVLLSELQTRRSTTGKIEMVSASTQVEASRIYFRDLLVQITFSFFELLHLKRRQLDNSMSQSISKHQGAALQLKRRKPESKKTSTRSTHSK